MYCTKLIVLALSILLNIEHFHGAPVIEPAKEICEEQPRDLFLVVDDSASIGHTDIRKVRHFLSSLISAVHISRDMTRVGFLQFSDDVTMRYNLDNNLNAQEMKLQFENMEYKGGPKTMTHLGLKMVSQQVFTKTGGDRPDVPDILVVFTDGQSRKKELTIAEALVLKEMGVRIIAIGAGENVAENSDMLAELNSIASSPSDVKLVDFADLDSIVVDIVNRVCTLITTSKPPPPTRTFQPETRKPVARIRAPFPSRQIGSVTLEPTYSTTLSPIGCSAGEGKDILFLIDGTANFQDSYDLYQKDFNRIKKFIKVVTKDLADDRFRVGVMQYTDQNTAAMEVQFLKPKQDFREIKFRLDTIVLQRGYKRYTGDAMVKANHQFYELDALHQREQNPNVIVLITRGDAYDRKYAISEALMLESRNIRVITIGLGPTTKDLTSFLHSVADPKFIFLSKYKDLKKHRVQILDAMCTKKDSLPRPGLPRESAECRRSPHDIFFVIDGSASIKRYNFEKVQIFLMDLISLLKVEPSDINTGLMQFSREDQTSMIWDLGKYSEFETIMTLQNMNYQAGRRTETGDALTRVNKEVFTKKNGDRPGVTDILILFTDGNAHDFRIARKQAAILKREKGVLIVTIGAGTDASLVRFKQELLDLSSGPEFAMTVNFEELDVFAERFFPLVCRSLRRKRL